MKSKSALHNIKSKLIKINIKSKLIAAHKMEKTNPEKNYFRNVKGNLQ